jgi:hypothetical protein
MSGSADIDGAQQGSTLCLLSTFGRLVSVDLLQRYLVVLSLGSVQGGGAMVEKVGMSSRRCECGFW